MTFILYGYLMHFRELGRAESIEPVENLTISLIKEMGTSPHQRVEWFSAQTGASFGQILKRINATLRGIPPEAHTFDGEGVHAGAVDTSVPPDQEDKETLLDELVQRSQEYSGRRFKEGASPQILMTELAMVIPTVVNKLHLFGDGNGRSTRELRMVLRDADQATPDKNRVLINKTNADGKQAIERYETEPAGPVEQAVQAAITQENGTEENDNFSIYDDVRKGEISGGIFDDETQRSVKASVAGLDDRVANARKDTFNFDETIRCMAKAQGRTGQISLTSMLEQTRTPEGLKSFLDQYRDVRKQRVSVLIQALLGEKDLPLTPHGIHIWINRPRKHIGRRAIDPSLITTAQEFQMAYVETFSPPRAAARRSRRDPKQFRKHA